MADDDSLKLLADAGADVDTLFEINMQSPPVSNGRATEAEEFKFTVDLTPRWLKYFKSDGFYVRTQIEASSAIGDTLNVVGSDYISVQPFARLVYTVRPGRHG